MKRSFQIALAVAALTVSAPLGQQGRLHAQSLEGMQAGVVERDGKFVWSSPRTVIRVSVTLQRESVRKGPYARYSQKYLGVIAPLNDKDIFTVAGAVIGYVDPAAPASAGGEPLFGAQTGTTVSAPALVPVMSSDTGFVRLPVNITSAVAQSPETMAAAAAAAIFKIRKQRSDLVSGDAGENVFGAGLPSALDELNRQEQEYLELFLGKQFTQQITRTFEITPETRTFSYTVCKVSDTAGFVDAAAKSAGRAITLELKAEKPDISAPSAPNKKGVSYSTFVFPAITACRVLDGAHELATGRFPVYQYGASVDIAVTK